MSEREFFAALQARGALVLPADLRRRHHLDDPGAQVRIVERDDGVIELHPMAAIPADQRWYWTERWQRMEREVDAHVAARHESVHDDLDSFLGSLDD